MKLKEDQEILMHRKSLIFKMEEEDKKEKASCKSCGSKLVYIRIKEGSIVCRSCGYIDKIED